MAKGRKAETSSTSNGSQHEVIETVRGLAEVVAEHGLSELVVEIEGTTITLRRGAIAAPAMHMQMPMQMHMPAPMQQAPAAPFAHHAPAVAAPEPHDGAHVVTSPFVGTFYRRPNPDSPNYVAVNDKVEKGAVLCIVEAMKLMNEIEADIAGTIVAVLAEDGAPVEYGQPLFKIRP
jgi:acetyl-CoA carboxylase biotin carboxyl carrier protein